MKKVLIIDDEPLAASIIKDYLKSYPDVELVGELRNGFEGIKAITQHSPDLVFLDVQMPKLNGFELLELLETPPDVIFTTAYEEYALKAFDLHAIDYLLKPFSKERFDKAMQNWLQERSQQKESKTKALLDEVSASLPEQNRIVVKTEGNIQIIPFHEIQFLEAFDDYVKIHTAKETFLKKKTMNAFEKILPVQSFVRVHRSYIVQLQEITRIEPMGKETYIGILKDGTRVPLSRAGYLKLKGVLGL